MGCMELKICMSDKHHRYYKHTKFCQNPRGDPKFLVDLTRNDPLAIQYTYSRGDNQPENLCRTTDWKIPVQWFQHFLQFKRVAAYICMCVFIVNVSGTTDIDKYPGLESSGFSCRIIVTGSSNIFELITQKTRSTLASTP